VRSGGGQNEAIEWVMSLKASKREKLSNYPAIKRKFAKLLPWKEPINRLFKPKLPNHLLYCQLRRRYRGIVNLS
jgi:hypothetical protein